MKKKLAKYLANYIFYEKSNIFKNQVTEIQGTAEILEQGLEAFESTEDVVIEIRPESPLDTITDNALGAD